MASSKAMKKTVVKSKLSSTVKSVSWGGASQATTPSDADGGVGGITKKTLRLGDLKSNEEQWDRRRQELHGAIDITSTERLADEEPEGSGANGDDDMGGSGDVEMDIDPPASTTFNIPARAPNGQEWWAYRKGSKRFAYHRLVEPAVPFRRYDPRKWKDRIKDREAEWAKLIPGLTDAYLDWRSAQSKARTDSATSASTTRPMPSAPPSASSPANPSTTPSSNAVPQVPQPTSVPEASNATPGEHEFEVNVVRLREYVWRESVFQRDGESAAVALMRVGLVPCTPLNPSVAIDVEVLDMYYHIRRHAPRLGAQQFVKALCDIHDRVYARYLREQFAQAFDTFLAVVREVDGRVKTLLKRDGPNWRVKNSCSACRYKLDDEPELLIPAFIAVDGNVALRRSAAAGTADPRVFTSDYKIEDALIDLYANEVKRRLRVSPTPNATTQDDVRLDYSEESGEPGDDAPPTPCTLTWKAAKADHFKIAPGMFDQTGIYLAVCRHGLVVYYCEMRRSGELAKYPLGMFARLIAAGLAPVDVGADIGCALSGTLARSTLGREAQRLGLRVRMNAFHGYGHNRLCQVTEHPLYIKGFGLEDLEICERVFSASNHVAALVRHATHFHYSQFIDMFFQVWDEEKYAALSSFICNNYVQAQQMIDELEPVLEQYMTANELSAATIEGWRAEEKEFLESLKEEPREDVLAMEYVEALQELEAAESAADMTRADLEDGFISFHAEDLSNASQADIIKRNAKKRKAHALFKAAVANVESLERMLRVEVRWHRESDEYKAALESMRVREYSRCVDRLQYLMLQRLLELSKTHAVGTGYKMREAIGKHIKARSKAIGTAVKKYNEAARALRPPEQDVDFAKLMEWTELQEFDLVRFARRGDVRERDWAKPANRSIAVKYHKVQRAYEERERCVVELRRLVTAIRDEEAELSRILTDLQENGHALAHEVARRRRKRMAINAQHMDRIANLAEVPGMTPLRACLVPGVREGATPPAPVPSIVPATRSPASTSSHEDDVPESGDELDAEDAEQVDAMQDFIGNLE